MNGTRSQVTGIITSIIVLATITTLILPGRQTPKVLAAFFSGLANTINAAMGGTVK